MSPPHPSISPPPLKRRRLSPPPTSPILTPLPQSTPNAPINPLNIYTWNINGLAPFLSPPKPQKITSFFLPTTPPPPSSSSKSPTNLTSRPSLRDCLHRWNWPHILCLQELKIPSAQRPWAETTLQRIINEKLDSEPKTEPLKNERSYDAHFAFPSSPHNARGPGGKGGVYGVCMLVRRDLHPCTIKDLNWDLEGRVVALELPESKLMVMGVYAVNGTNSSHYSALTGEIVGTRHEWKREFHSLLKREVENYERQEGWGVVVAGDLNISRSRIDSFPAWRMGREHVLNRADFEGKFMAEMEKGGLGMLDSFREVWGQVRKFTYRPRGRGWGTGGDRVDLILVSRRLREKVVEADVLDTEEERGGSDHVPLFLVLELGNGGDSVREEGGKEGGAGGGDDGF